MTSVDVSDCRERTLHLIAGLTCRSVGILRCRACARTHTTLAQLFGKALSYFFLLPPTPISLFSAESFSHTEASLPCVCVSHTHTYTHNLGRGNDCGTDRCSTSSCCFHACFKGNRVGASGSLRVRNMCSSIHSKKHDIIS